MVLSLLCEWEGQLRPPVKCGQPKSPVPAGQSTLTNISNQILVLQFGQSIWVNKSHPAIFLALHCMLYVGQTSPKLYQFFHVAVWPVTLLSLTCCTVQPKKPLPSVLYTKLSKPPPKRHSCMPFTQNIKQELGSYSHFHNHNTQRKSAREKQRPGNERQHKPVQNVPLNSLIPKK